MARAQPGLTLLGKIFVVAVIATSAYGAWYYFTRQPVGRSLNTPSSSSAAAPSSGAGVTIGIAYGTEKQRWLQSAVEQFAKTREGSELRIELIPMGSLEAA